MKKTLLSLMFIAFLASAHSQIGIRGGLNLANVSISTSGLSVSPSNKIGIHAGLTYDFSLSENIILRPGLLYSGKGFKLNVAGFDDISSSSNYIDIPINVVYKVGTADSGLFLTAGPYIGLLMSASQDGEDVKEELKGTDIGINFGLGYNINSNISAGIEYGLGLTNIAAETIDDQSIKNKNIAIYLLYRI